MDATRDELSDTMAVVQLSGMEIIDLTMELSDNGSDSELFCFRSRELVEVKKSSKDVRHREVEEEQLMVFNHVEQKIENSYYDDDRACLKCSTQRTVTLSEITREKVQCAEGEGDGGTAQSWRAAAAEGPRRDDLSFRSMWRSDCCAFVKIDEKMIKIRKTRNIFHVLAW
ncbi:hypothetical protein SASPL_108630 [Salvia splendens]|uniref:Uncharacterized protein n=1 Tax=Salvia splendens TaxID=180675 RepID=A0A8X8YCM2_SALSN|nr:hypothetical protein SASPL_108630 [Salvia splendens]